MVEAACTNSSEFDLLEYRKTRDIVGVDESGTVVVPARWSPVGLVARLFAGIDTASCPIERKFSEQKLAVRHLRASMGSSQVETNMLLKINKYLNPWLGKP